MQNANEELAEKVRDLEESLAERDCRDDPCEKVKYVRGKIAALRDRFAAEKKQYVTLIDCEISRVLRALEYTRVATMLEYNGERERREEPPII